MKNIGCNKLLGPLMYSVASLVFMPSMAQAECPAPEKRLAEIVNIAKTSDVLVLAHRGYWGQHAGLPDLPENSLGSISTANSACMDGIELDVKMSKDGVPILMHDFNLGRTTNVYRLNNQAKYNPITNAGANYKVHDVLAADIDRLRLLTPDRRSETGFVIPRVSQVLDVWKANGMRTPLVFDTKTADAIRAIDILVRVKQIGGANTMAVKVNATLYPDPAGFYAEAKNLNVIPVYTTNMLGVISIADSFTKWSRAVQTIEINVKQKNGLLHFQKSAALLAGKRVGVFQAIPDGPVRDQFYKNTGACCYKLSDMFYHHRVLGQPAGSDTADHRGDLNFLLSEGYGLITSDDPKGAVRFLARAGKRRSHYQDY